MTEKAAWLELAEMFDSVEPLPIFRGEYCAFPVVGICDAILRQGLPLRQCSRMRQRLTSFQPKEWAIWYWPENITRTSRTLRATACCFLAAMCDD